MLTYPADVLAVSGSIRSLSSEQDASDCFQEVADRLGMGEIASFYKATLRKMGMQNALPTNPRDG
ncbi:hypothetical protein P7K49_019602 [Saguinus oedipus]|uniref:Uncharacterized protein n=1 Tax=Saguinus oedipus TaxID=9490 RepID=A0ABQ9UYL3_SAGOE|nr:hypothetical protein P7K49_019602 [Saguinus oedipus]